MRIKIFIFLMLSCSYKITAQVRLPSQQSETKTKTTTTQQKQITSYTAPAPKTADVAVTWTGQGTVALKINNTEYPFTAGSTQTINLEYGKLLEIAVKIPGKTFYATEYLLIDATGGIIEVSVNDKNAVFIYENPIEYQERLKTAQIERETKTKELSLINKSNAETEKSESNYKFLISDGDKRFDEGKYLQAKETYQYALDVKPDDVYCKDRIFLCGILANMIHVEGGTFEMGCITGKASNCSNTDKPQHKVSVKSFYINKFEVTQQEWIAIMGDSQIRFKGCNQCPVDGVNFKDITEFLGKLNNMSQKRFRLPSEAEWEYAARGGIKSLGYLYCGSDDLLSVGWFAENSGAKTHPVGQKLPNELNLYDMSGNVFEWCSDWFGEDYYKEIRNSVEADPKGPVSGDTYVIRGGSWAYADFRCQSFTRSKNTPDNMSLKYGNSGLRLVMEK